MALWQAPLWRWFPPSPPEIQGRSRASRTAGRPADISTRLADGVSLWGAAAPSPVQSCVSVQGPTLENRQLPMETPPSEPPPLPRRDEAMRCAETDGDRRCVLPLDHPGDHVYPRQPDT
ncbi:hypothetical protein Skr01_36050 [Sphaerisporangium krabiense]|nr:hypothetical protein Skr01_36050 [Sphaerisporangium krabiense]